MTLPLLVVTTVARQADAQRLARELVESGLVACAQIETIQSVYRWQGQVHCEAEFRVLFKTLAPRYAAVEAAILARHPYELPAIHAIECAQAHAPYARWVASAGASDGSGGAAAPAADPAAA